MGSVPIARAADNAQPKPFVHPGILQTRADLDLMKSKIRENEQPWKGAWERLLSQSYSSLKFVPKPAEHVIRGPFGRPSIGSNELIASANAAESHALQWYVTGNKAHAAKVIEIFNAWSPILNDFQQNDAKLLAGWTGHQLLAAAEIIRYTDAGWLQTDIDQFKKMILGVYYPLIKDFYPDANGNWDAAIMDTMLCIGIFCDDHDIFDRAVDHYLRGHLNGGITHYVYPSGQCQESTRDQAHTQLGLGEMAQACQVAWIQGIDLFGSANNRLALGYEYTAQYMLGQNVQCENTISQTGRGKFSDIYFVAYDHYHFEKGLPMPYVAMAVEQTAPRSHTVLTMYKGPRTGVTITTQPAPTPDPFALAAGAANAPTATPRPGAITVEPGNSIQAALDSAQKNGGWVVLAQGVHTLPAALRIPNGVTLAGQGRNTIVWLDPHLTGPAIVNADDAPHDIALRDFVVEGAIATGLSTDPNTGRRTRSRPGALSRAGVFLAPRGQEPARNLRIEHLTVRNCTATGVQINASHNVTVEASSFTDNGNLNADTTANLLLIQVSASTLAHTRVNNSPSGCGIRLLDCKDISITSNEIARNARDGIHLIDSINLHVHGNLIEGNEADAVAADASRVIDVTGNLIQNNTGFAVPPAKDVDLTVRDKRGNDNGRN
jgi:parallel beta-helix repeat protein